MAAPPPDVSAFGDEVRAVLASALGEELVGVWFVGSIALGGYVAGESDVDIAAVCRGALGAAAKAALADRLSATTAHCPTRGLELTLYRSEVAASVSDEAAFELNVNGGPRMAREVRLSADGQPGFWYVLDRAIAHRRGVAISGPAASAVFADVDRARVLRALGASMRWHREHEKATLYSVLNACRAWRFAVDGALVSKIDGGEWALGRVHGPDRELIKIALDQQRSISSAEPDRNAVNQFVRQALSHLAKTST